MMTPPSAACTTSSSTTPRPWCLLGTSEDAKRVKTVDNEGSGMASSLRVPCRRAAGGCRPGRRLIRGLLRPARHRE
jgi:hypothetical protein